MQEHLDIVETEQLRMGLTKQELNFLTPGQVSGVKQQLMEASRSTTGAADSVSMLEQLEQQYGPRFPVVYGQLLREDALEEEHIAMMTYDNAADRIALAQVINDKDEIFASKFVKDNLNDIRLDVEKAMLPLMRALNPEGATPTVSSGLSTNKQLKSIRDAAILQVSASVMSSGTYDPSKVARYTTDIFDKSYNFDNEVRIPKNRGHDANRISSSIGSIQNGRGYTFADDLMFAMPPPIGVSDEQNQIDIREQFNRGVRVVTNADESGVIYLWSNGKTVEIIQGGRAVPLGSSFADLERMNMPITSRFPGKTGAGSDRGVTTLRLGPGE